MTDRLSDKELARIREAQQQGDGSNNTIGRLLDEIDRLRKLALEQEDELGWFASAADAINLCARESGVCEPCVGDWRGHVVRDAIVDLVAAIRSKHRAEIEWLRAKNKAIHRAIAAADLVIQRSIDENDDAD
jgi:hypothetical protein